MMCKQAYLWGRGASNRGPAEGAAAGTGDALGLLPM